MLTLISGDLLFEGGLKVGFKAAFNSTFSLAVCKCVVIFALSAKESIYLEDSGVSGELIDMDALLLGLTVKCFAELKILKVSTSFVLFADG